jgi:hypothetical protein
VGITLKILAKVRERTPLPAGEVRCVLSVWSEDDVGVK